MRKAILMSTALVLMAVAGGGAWGDALVKKTPHLTRAQFQEKIKAHHAKNVNPGRKIGGTAVKGAPQVSPRVVK